MSAFAYAVDAKQARELSPADALACEAELVWIHLCYSDDEAKAWLGGEAKLPDYLIDALTAAETRPRCEQMLRGAFVNLRGLSADVGHADTLASVRLYATNGRVYSVTRRPLNALDVVKGMVADGRVADPGDLIAAFAGAITEQLDPVVANLGDQLDECEADIDPARAFDLRRLVTRVRVEAIGYKRFLFPQRAALEKLGALEGEWLQPDDRQHLAAAADRAARMAEEVDAIRERAGLMHETLTDLRAELIDERGLIISIAAMVFLPLTFLTGLYGMNVEGLWLADKPWAFDAIVALCAALAAGVTGYFVWRHWTR